MRTATLEGLAAAAATGGACAALHFASMNARWYKRIPEPPRRILYAVLIVGAFSFQAHLSGAWAVERNNKTDMIEWESKTRR